MEERTQREPHGGAEVYTTPAPRHTGQRLNGDAAAPAATVDVVTPTDRVRWGAIMAGLFTTVTTLILLSVAGLAIGLVAFDPNSSARSFGIGSGIWGAITWLLAFGLGGWVAARTAAPTLRNNGLLNGTLVGVVAIPLILYLVGSLLGSLLGTAGSVAGTTAQVAAPAAGQVADDPAAQADAQQAGADAAQQAQQTAEQLAAQAQQNAEAIATGAAAAAGGAILPLVLGLGAAALGGWLGGRTRADDYQPAMA